MCGRYGQYWVGRLAPYKRSPTSVSASPPEKVMIHCNYGFSMSWSWGTTLFVLMCLVYVTQQVLSLLACRFHQTGQSNSQLGYKELSLCHAVGRSSGLRPLTVLLRLSGLETLIAEDGISPHIEPV